MPAKAPPTPLDQKGGNKTMSLSNGSVVEDVYGAQIGVLTTTAPSSKFTFTVDDPRLEVVAVGGQTILRLKGGESLDYETAASLDIRITATDKAGLSKTQTFTIKVVDVNEAPTDITLSNATIAENSEGAMVGLLTGADPERGALSFSVVGTEASRFETVQNAQTGAWELRLKAGVALDHEQAGSCDVTVRVSDGSLTYDKVMRITIGDVNEAPTSVSLSSHAVAENAEGAAIGQLSTVDPDKGDTVTYQVFRADAFGALLLVNGEAVVDNRFTVDASGNLKLATGVSLDHEATPEVHVVVRATDSSSLSRDEAIAITVTNANDAPTGTLAISHTTRVVETTTTHALSAADITNPSTQFFNAANGHIYEFVNTDVRWDQALSLSASKSLGGVQGHLVTITSSDEQAFIVSQMGLITVGWNKDEIWTAASDAQQEGHFVWMAGPEQGQSISYADWAWPGGPSNYTVGSDYGVLTVSPYYDTSGAWMDLHQEWFVGGSRTWENSSSYSRTYQGNGYVVEYSGQATETTRTTVHVLSVDTSSIADQDGAGEFTFQWQRSSDGITWADVPGATGDEYEAGQADNGMYLRAHAWYQDGGSTVEHVYSPAELVKMDDTPPDPPADTKPDGLLELNGHYYRIVESPYASHADALAAEGSSFVFNGVEYKSHLATVNSAQEEDFIESAILAKNKGSYYTAEPAAFWLGGEYKDGAWQWTSGPDSGKALTHTDWGFYEATQGTDEPYLVLNMFGRSDINGVWYSYDAGDTGLVRGYVMEYEALA